MGHGSAAWTELVPLALAGAGCLLGLGMTEREQRAGHATPGGADGPFRWPTIALLFVAALAHVPVIPEHLEEARYMGVLFVAFSVAAFALAAVLAARPTPLVYAASGPLCAAAVLAYVATRLVAFPQLADDVGNWTEPLGLVAITAECGVVLLSAMATRQPQRVHGPRRGPG